MFDARRGAWSTFQFLVRERLLEEGVEVERDGVGRLDLRRAASAAARRSRQNAPSCGARTAGSGSAS